LEKWNIGIMEWAMQHYFENSFRVAAIPSCQRANWKRWNIGIMEWAKQHYFENSFRVAAISSCQRANWKDGILESWNGRCSTILKIFLVGNQFLPASYLLFVSIVTI
jgi:hypothetical protein